MFQKIIFLSILGAFTFACSRQIKTEQSDKKSKLIIKLEQLGYPMEEVATGLDDFFVGNEDLGSIGVNLDPHPGLKKFYKVLNQIKSSQKTELVLVRIANIENGDWPYSDAIYVIGDWNVEELRIATASLRPDDIVDGWMYDKPVNIDVSQRNVHTIWWD